ncbi:2OG-Fe dioxygenase family protein [Nocardia iowensis]|uniref:2OG-Fe dioxygenase family protein n=1 Tax=Nocardia iowensis TaxID=204891 RepID=A0ABX8RY67_NOCIO|nr:2OG-Fe dioxygenase family protein [Nocardia iowensis]QXN94608.1 2OG-Fe dioxygenase family protein [Nocardia iowensis]
MLEEHTDTTIVVPAGVPGRHPHLQRRTYRRVTVLTDPAFKALVERMLQLIPPQSRQGSGTFAIHLLRTFTNVVTGVHQDGEQYVFVYVLDKHAQGGETILYSGDGPRNRVFGIELRPGQLLAFDDVKFLHEATPLRPLPGQLRAHRDALVCTVNLPKIVGR